MEPRTGSRKKWIIALAVAIVILLLCCGTSAAGFIGCQGALGAASKERVAQIRAALTPAAAGHEQALVYEQQLDRLEVLADDGALELLAFGVLENRYKDISRDGEITAEELDFMMALITDIDDGEGRIDMRRYPRGR